MRESDLDSMRLTYQQVVGIAPCAVLLMGVQMRLLDAYPTLQLWAWGIDLTLSHLWFLQVNTMLCVFCTMVATHTSLPWSDNVYCASVAVQEMLDNQYLLLTAVPSHLHVYVITNYHKDVFHPRWYVVVFVASLQCNFATLVYYAMLHLSGFRPDVVVQLYGVGVLLCWVLNCGMLAKMMYIYKTKSILHVQLEIDWVWCNAIYWFRYLRGELVAPTSIERKFVWKHVTRPMSQREKIACLTVFRKMNIEFDTVPPIRRLARGVSPGRRGARELVVVGDSD